MAEMRVCFADEAPPDFGLGDGDEAAECTVLLEERRSSRTVTVERVLPMIPRGCRNWVTVGLVFAFVLGTFFAASRPGQRTPTQRHSDVVVETLLVDHLDEAEAESAHRRNSTAEVINGTEETEEEMAARLAAEEAAAAAKKAAEQAALLKLCGGEGGNVNCAKSQCCKEPGHQCFAKNAFWAECMEECTPGPNLFDHGSHSVWSCQKLGERKSGPPKQCAAGRENCLETQCCAGLGMQCYRKNSTFGACKATCEDGVDMADEDWHPWSCERLGNRTKMPAPWIEEKCSKGPANCISTQCCAEEGFQCYLGNKFWGQCKPRCSPWQWDACAPVGSRTPKLASMILSEKEQVGPWVEERCSGKWEDCSSSKCCYEIGTTCYVKDAEYATCRPDCNSTSLLEEKNETWSCEALGPTSWGLATKGYPSLYCISLYMPSHYEGPLLKSVAARGAGVFACDGFDVFASEEDTLGKTPDGMTVKAVLIPKIQVGVSQDGTAGNAKLFMAVWDKVIAGGRFRYYDWTIKVDPDAVLLPWRLRGHLATSVGKKAYVVNCDKYPLSKNFPMMYGAVEVFSQAAMAAYAELSWKCGQQLRWHQWGEDYYMTHCMDYIGVNRISDFGVLGDNVCVGANCEDGGVASFHPFKTQDAWHKCWNAANDLPEKSRSALSEA